MLAWCFLWGIMPSHLLAETPIQALQETLDRFQHVLHDSALLEDSRKEQVLETIMARFDVREMSKRILGPHWEPHHEQQDAFVAEFTAFMKRIFSKQFDQIKGLKVACREERYKARRRKW
jgi:ABC-type transporter MlaC component